MPGRSRFSPEFKRDAVALYRSAEKSVNQVAADLGISHETLRNWVRQDRIDSGHGQPDELTTDQLAELRRLRREVAELRTEREILRKATAYFAQEMGR